MTRIAILFQSWTIRLLAGGIVLFVLAVGVGSRIGGAGASERCTDVAEGAIVESVKFTPYAGRRDGPVNQVAILPDGAQADAEVPSQAAVRVTSLDGLARQHTIVGQNGEAYAYFLDEALNGLSRNEFISRGGIELDQDPRVTGTWFAANLIELHEGRALPVAVGAFDGALTWGDPDINGVRAHNVYWSDGQYEYALTADRSAASLVTLARSLAC